MSPSFAVLLASAHTSGALPASALGVAGVFVTALTTAVWTLWKSNQAKDSQIVDLLTKSVSALTQASGVIAEDRKTMQALSDRAISVEQLRHELDRWRPLG